MIYDDTIRYDICSWATYECIVCIGHWECVKTYFISTALIVVGFLLLFCPSYTLLISVCGVFLFYFIILFNSGFLYSCCCCCLFIDRSVGRSFIFFFFYFMTTLLCICVSFVRANIPKHKQYPVIKNYIYALTNYNIFFSE